LTPGGRDEGRLDGNVAGGIGRNGGVGVFVVESRGGFPVVACVDVAAAKAVGLDAVAAGNLAG